MATKINSTAKKAVSASTEDKEQRIVGTLKSISSEERFNTLEDGSKGAGYFACTIELADGNSYGGVIYSKVVDNGTEEGDTVSCKIGVDSKGNPILRVLGTGSARISWDALQKLGIDVPSMDSGLFK